MNFEKGELLYSVGTANAGRATVVASMAIHAMANQKMNPEQYKDFKALTETQFPQGLCFPLVALWTRDLLTERHSLRAMVRAPDSIVHHSQLSLARDMQSEHMTRVRKRVAQNKFGPQARQEVELENKVLGAYTGLAQKPRIHKRAIADGAPERESTARDVAVHLVAVAPLHMAVAYAGGGSHALGLVMQRDRVYVFEPNRGLLEYYGVGVFLHDLQAYLAGENPVRRVKELSLFEFSLSGEPTRREYTKR